MRSCKANILLPGQLICSQIWVLLFLGLMIPAQAEEAFRPDSVPQARATLERLQREVASADTATAQELNALRKEIAVVRSSALGCIQDTEPKIALLDSEIAVLQPEQSQGAKTKTAGGDQSPAQPAAPVSPVIAGQLQNLQNQKANLEGRVADCKLMLLSSNDLDSNVDDYLRSLEARQLLTRGATLPEVLRANLDERQRWLDLADRLAAILTGRNPVYRAHLAGAATAGVLGCFLGLIVFRIGGRRLRTRIAPDKVEKEQVSKGLVQAFMASGVSYAPILLALAGISAYLLLIPSSGGDRPFLVSIIYGLLAYFAIAAIIRALLDPCPPATAYLPLSESIAIPLGRRSRFLVLIALLRWLIQELHAGGLLDESMYALARHIIGWLFVLNVIWVCWLLRRLDGWRHRWAVLLLISLALFAGIIAAAIGYVNLGSLIIVGIAYSLALLGLALVISQVLSDVFDGLDQGRYGWQKTVRRAMGLKDEDYVPGLGWLRLVVHLGLWLGASLLLLRVWDPEEQITSNLLRNFTEGFQVGGLTIVPTHLLWAILVFAISLPLTGWLKGRLNTKWLVETRMEASAREALVTTFGYVAVAIAAMVALSLAGISFGNLAIIAGALSVGVGFGLQNIVNNFVSGIIMLVERPVRNGDWIVVGDTEGYVQRINIRTTTIQTFDRADVIVPNSALISGQVTNWTLGNTWGRIKMPIGVAYGSDVETVIQTLVDVANSHAEVIKGNPQLPDPYALFLDFGDSSLDFELRVIIRDIKRRRYVTSDLNRAINAAFNEKGIEIPFPQRDINFRGPLQVEPGSDALPGHTGGESSHS
jgi:small-conductance mechanosensitive channel